jgi:UDP-N-acetylmuramyl pentapeptide synthase
MKQLAKRVVQAVLAWAARRVLAAHRPVIVGVTGSAGKTSTKDAIGHVLSQTLTQSVRTAEGNLNSEFGVPLAVLGLPRPTDVKRWFTTVGRALQLGLEPTHFPNVVVLEYGAEFPGDIATLVAIAQPAVAVVTNVGPAHLEFFGTLDAVAREKVTLIVKVPATGLVVLNTDDPFADWMAKQTRAEVIRVRGEGSQFARAAALAVAAWFDVSSEQATQALSSWSPPAGRLVPLPGISGATILDDSYNANPSSMTLALNIGRRFASRTGARLVAVLGDMLELGADEARYHRGIALLAQKAADVSVLVGRRFTGMPATHHVLHPDEAVTFLKSTLRAGDTVLVKGSQGMRMERIVAALLADPADTSKLVRQSPDWQAKPFVQP